MILTGNLKTMLVEEHEACTLGKVGTVKSQPFAYAQRIGKIGLATLVLGLVLMGTQFVHFAWAQSPDALNNSDTQLTAGETIRVIVSLRQPVVRSGTDRQIRAIAQAQTELLAEIPREGFHLIQQFETLPGLAGEVTPQGLEALLEHPAVAAVTPDLPVEIALTESVALIGADAVWRDWGFTGAGVNVAVLDTGIDTTHPDLADNLVAQKCFGRGVCPPDNSDEGNSAEDGNGHGTHVAGIITGRGETSPRGVAPDTGIVAVRVMDDNGSGFTSDVITAIDWIMANQAQLNVKAINLSLGGGAYQGVCDTADANTQLYAQAVQLARQAGITIFAASGNRGLTDEMMAPACVSGVIAVGGTYDADLGQVTLGGCTDENATIDQVACVSNSSPELGLLAPGMSIISTALGGGQRTESGTSMSTAHATAVAAFMLQADPNLTPPEIEEILKETGVPVTDHRNGRVTPRIDALAAVNRISGSQTGMISGTVLLQSRDEHSGTQIFLGQGPCEKAMLSASAATTGIHGHFEIPALPAGPQPQCVQVIQPGFLVGQHSAPTGDLGVITLLGGEVTGDGVINIFDLAFIAARYNSSDPLADITADGLVDIFDLVIAAGNYEQQGPQTDWQ
jgi:hypothetical protein